MKMKLIFFIALALFSFVSAQTSEETNEQAHEVAEQLEEVSEEIVENASQEMEEKAEEVKAEAVEEIVEEQQEAVNNAEAQVVCTPVEPVKSKTEIKTDRLSAELEGMKAQHAALPDEDPLKLELEAKIAKTEQKFAKNKAKLDAGEKPVKPGPMATDEERANYEIAKAEYEVRKAQLYHDSLRELEPEPRPEEVAVVVVDEPVAETSEVTEDAAPAADGEAAAPAAEEPAAEECAPVLPPFKAEKKLAKALSSNNPTKLAHARATLEFDRAYAEANPEATFLFETEKKTKAEKMAEPEMSALEKSDLKYQKAIYKLELAKHLATVVVPEPAPAFAQPGNNKNNKKNKKN
eukprot:CAMPEP_0174260264 /NCGR_PEP_ID=MMETSP0439-20130205/9425_1 /TAXON_ID=0 /ORGANISM="Stereomyxa ramosa, Strain Chinc5" /LENGTH=349 /DNA_ID=CAMNT_0015344473 /DNA_START=46 /DNA_END=1095 /DNA_ORIENTATION=+